ncbi:MAG: MarR family transcriptional regulator [Ramlibacter sp.]|uniref:MarR family winged helix-turn-helix transcriptional regulator n=1 Tax=Ramlibacter sp. TaxID=1917967 RepID=UPI00262EB6C4|nr:MarR family transcriptional regulator [Ramlibacter sp.]MDB5753000.1 MarR family transcriptional regulator [Ramlibacter sp.]
MSTDRPGRVQADSSGDLLELVHAVMHQVRARQQLALRDGVPLTPMEARVLRFFGRHPGCTQSDLAQHSGRDKAQLARLITGLRERGLLAGQADPADRRNLRLRLTDEGEALTRVLRQSLRKLGAQAAAGLSLAEREQLTALLQRVHGNLKE